MFSWLHRKKEPIPLGPWEIRVDIHNHVLPGIDDGAQDLEQSAFLLQGLVDLGFQEIIATPHTAAGLYLNSPGSISAAFETEALADARSVAAKAPARVATDGAFILRGGLEFWFFWVADQALSDLTALIIKSYCLELD